jgi:hypothetical protein
VKGGVFLRKTPLEFWGFGIQQLWNRFSAQNGAFFGSSGFLRAKTSRDFRFSQKAKNVCC